MILIKISVYIWYLSLFQAQNSINTWNFLSDRGTKVSGFCFFYVNEVTFGSLIGHLRWRLDAGGKAHVIGELGGRRGEGMEAGWINVQWFNQLYLGNEGSVKTQIDGVLRATRLRSTEVWRGRCIWREHGGSFLWLLLPIFHLAVPELHPFIINEWTRKEMFLWVFLAALAN